MNFIFKHIMAPKKKELMFRAMVDCDGDFAVQVSVDDAEWWDLCFVDCEDGTLVLNACLPRSIGLQLDNKGQIVVM
jgi:hypothetical protein